MTCKVETTKELTGHPHYVIVDGVTVGTGGEKECAALAAELAEDDDKAEAVRDMFAED